MPSHRIVGRLSGQVEHVVRLVIRAGQILQGGSLSFYKDATPTRAADIGLNPVGGALTDDLIFSLYNGAWFERMRIANGGDVGIGTTSPQQLLDLHNTGSAGTVYPLRLINNATATAGTGVGIEFGFLAGAQILSTIEAVHTGGSQTDLTFSTQNGAVNENMRILGSGNVGIGTTSPIEKLSIEAGHINLNHSTIPYMRFQRAGGEHGYVGSAGALFAGAQTDFGERAEANLIFGTSSAEYMRIQSGGNVGIGTTSPLVRLDVSGDANGAVRVTSTEADATNKHLNIIQPEYTNANGHFRVIGGRGESGNNSVEIGGGYGGYDAATLLRFYTAPAVNTDVGTERMTINSAGNVGIGTAAPSGKFHVNLATNEMALLGTSSASGIWGVNGGMLSQSSIFQIVSTAANPMIFYTGGTYNTMTAGNERMRIESGGNIGIGTTTPAKNLHVADASVAPVAFERTGSDGPIVSILQDGIEEGTISVATNTVSYNAFTGSHYGWTDRSIETGTLVALTGDNRRLHDNADSEIIYGVTPSSIPNDPKILGAYLALQESQDPAGPDNPHLVMAVGNGVMWVVGAGQDVAIGDHLISSGVAGHAMRDTGEFLVSHIVAIAVEPVDWDEVEQSTDGRKHRRISVLFERFAMNHIVQTAAESAELAQVKAELSELQSEKETLARSNDELRMQLDALTAAVKRLEESQLKLAAR